MSPGPALWRTRPRVGCRDGRGFDSPGPGHDRRSRRRPTARCCEPSSRRTGSTPRTPCATSTIASSSELAGAWRSSAGKPIAVVLQYAGYSPQPVFVMGENAGIDAILAHVIKPRAAYVAARPEHLPAIAASYRVDPGPPMLRMWVDRAHFRPFPADVRRLLPGRDRRAEPAVPARLRGLAPGERDRRRPLLRHPRRRAARLGRRDPRHQPRREAGGGRQRHDPHGFSRPRVRYRRHKRRDRRPAALLRPGRAQRSGGQSAGAGGLPTPRLPGHT